jgi:hypothetical protein
LSVPASASPQCFLAHTDPAGNFTWVEICSSVAYSVGQSVVVSGKKLLLSGSAGVDGNVPPDTPGFLFAAGYVLP